MKTNAKKLLLAASLLTAGFSPEATAQTKSTDAAAPAIRGGLLGENYFGVSAAWYTYDDLPIDAQGISLEFNWAMIPRLDLTGTLELLETDPYLGVEAEMQSFLVGVRWFNTQKRVSFYAEALGGVAVAKTDFLREDAFAYRLGVGAEFQVAGTFTLTPFAYYQEYATSYDSDGSFFYGVKGNVWVHHRVGIMASYFRNSDGDSTTTLGLNFRF